MRRVKALPLGGDQLGWHRHYVQVYNATLRDDAATLALWYLLLYLRDHAETYRVWPDGTCQSADETPYNWMSDDYQFELVLPPADQDVLKVTT